MAMNTCGSARRAQGKYKKTESWDRTKDINSCSCITSKAAVSRGNRDESLSISRFYTYRAKLNKDKKVTLDIDFTAEEDELEYYISLV
jgi:hypothetical protein